MLREFGPRAGHAWSRVKHKEARHPICAASFFQPHYTVNKVFAYFNVLEHIWCMQTPNSFGGCGLVMVMPGQHALAPVRGEAERLVRALDCLHLA